MSDIYLAIRRLVPLLFLLRSLSTVPLFFFFFNDTATTEIYTLSLHDALPISAGRAALKSAGCAGGRASSCSCSARTTRSEEHTSELQSQSNLVCRLLLEKKKITLNI